MARIFGVDIPNNKIIGISLGYIYGLGRNNAKAVLKAAQVDFNKKTSELTADDITRIREACERLKIRTEGELKRLVSSNIKRLVDIKSYRGSRHKRGLPSRGQKTRKNCRTRKGKKKTVGGLKRVLTKT